MRGLAKASNRGLLGRSQPGTLRRRDRYGDDSARSTTRREESLMPDERPILVTGAAGSVGAVGRTVVDMLRQRNLSVRALVHREDDRAATLRATGAEVVVG